MKVLKKNCNMELSYLITKYHNTWFLGLGLFFSPVGPYVYMNRLYRFLTVYIEQLAHL